MNFCLSTSHNIVIP